MIVRQCYQQIIKMRVQINFFIILIIFYKPFLFFIIFSIQISSGLIFDVFHIEVIDYLQKVFFVHLILKSKFYLSNFIIKIHRSADMPVIQSIKQTIIQNIFYNIYTFQSSGLKSQMWAIITLLLQFIYNPVMIFFILQGNGFRQYAFTEYLRQYVMQFGQNKYKSNFEWVIVLILLLSLSYILLLILNPSMSKDKKQFIKQTRKQRKLINKIAKVLGYFFYITSNLLLVFNTYFLKAEINIRGMASPFIYLSCLNIILLGAITRLFSGHALTFSYLEVNYLPSLNTDYFAESWIKIIMLVMLITNYKQNALYYVLQFMLLVHSVLQLKNCLRKNRYRSKDINNLNSLFKILQFYAILSHAIMMTNLLELLEHNVFLAIIFFGGFSFLALIHFRENEQFKIIFNEIEQIKTEDKLRLYIEGLYDLSTKKSNLLVIFAMEHMKNCRDVSCLCRQNNINTNVYSKNILGVATKKVIIHYSQQKEIVLQSLFFYFSLTENFVLINNYLRSLFKDMDNNQYAYYCLKRQIESFIEKRVNELKLNIIKQPLILQSSIEKLTDQTIHFCQSSKNKFKSLSKGFCHMQQFEKQINLELQILQKTIQFFQYGNKSFKKSTEFNVFFLFFFNSIVPVKSYQIMINQNISRIYQVGTINKISLQDKDFQRMILSKNCCTIQSYLKENEFGNINNLTKNVQNVFQYSKNQLLNLNVRLLLPPFLRNQHQTILQNWHKNGGWNKAGKITESFCLSKNKNCFLSYVMTGLRISLQGDISFVVTIWKGNDKDYLIIDDKNTVISYGKTFYQLIGVRQQLPIRYLFPSDNITRLDSKQVHRVTLVNFGNNAGYEQFRTDIQANNQNQQQELDSFFRDNLNTSCKCLIKTKMGHLGSKKYRIVKLIESHYKNEIKTNDLLNSQKSYEESLQQENKINPNQNTSEPNLIGDYEVHATNKVIMTALSFLMKPNSIRTQKMILVFIAVITLGLFIMSILTGTKLFYLQGISSIKEISESNAKVNNNYQLAKYMFDGMNQFQRQLKNFPNSNTSQLFQSNKRKNNLFYSIFAQNTLNYFKEEVELLSFSKHSYLMNKAQLMLKNTSIPLEISSFQFLQLEYYFCELYHWNTTTEQLNKITSFLLQNFNMLKQLCKNTLVEYRQKALYVNQLVQYVIVSNLGLTLLLTIILNIIILKFENSIDSEKYKSYDLYLEINNLQIVALKNHYSTISEYFYASDKKKLSYIQAQIPVIKANSIHQSTKTKIIKKINFKIIVRSVLFIILLNSFNVISGNNIYKLSDTAIEMTKTLNQLVLSQNLILEQYFNLKAVAVNTQQNATYAETGRKLVKNLQSNQVIFNTVVKKYIDRLKLQGMEEQSNNFLLLAIDDICESTQTRLSEYQYFTCVNNLQYNFVDHGLVLTFTYIQRTLQSFINSLITLNAMQDPYQVIKQQKQIEAYLIYLYKMNEIVQENIINSIENLIINSFSLQIVSLVVQVVLIFVLLIIWVITFNCNKITASKTYGGVVLIPYKVILENKLLQKKVQSLVNQ